MRIWTAAAALAGAAGLLAGSAAWADEPQQLSAQPGVPVPLAVETAVHDDCSVGEAPHTRIIVQPAHGEIAWRQGRLQKHGDACPPALGYVVLYVPDSDFTGSDMLTIEVVSEGTAHRIDFEIKIEGETTGEPRTVG